MSSIARHHSLQDPGHSKTLFILENDTDWNVLVSKLHQDLCPLGQAVWVLGPHLPSLLPLHLKVEIVVYSREELHDLLGFPNYLEGSAIHEIFCNMNPWLLVAEITLIILLKTIFMTCLVRMKLWLIWTTEVLSSTRCICKATGTDAHTSQEGHVKQTRSGWNRVEAVLCAPH